MQPGLYFQSLAQKMLHICTMTSRENLLANIAASMVYAKLQDLGSGQKYLFWNSPNKFNSIFLTPTTEVIYSMTSLILSQFLKFAPKYQILYKKVQLIIWIKPVPLIITEIDAYLKNRENGHIYVVQTLINNISFLLQK